MLSSIHLLEQNVRGVVSATQEWREGMPFRGVTDEASDVISVIPKEILAQPGWYLLAVVDQMYATFFTSQDAFITHARGAFISEYGGLDKLRYFVIPSTGEVVIIHRFATP